jgi:hypothetical protein
MIKLGFKPLYLNEFFAGIKGLTVLRVHQGMIPQRLSLGALRVRSLSAKDSVLRAIPPLSSMPGVSMEGNSSLRRVLRSQATPKTEFLALAGNSRRQKVITMDHNNQIIDAFTLQTNSRQRSTRTAVEPVSQEPADSDTGSHMQSSTNETGKFFFRVFSLIVQFRQTPTPLH